MRFLKSVLAALVLAAFAGAAPAMAQTAPQTGGAPAKERLVMELTYGRVVIELRPDLAPKHVARVKELAEKGFYDGIVFHRVIEGFMAQTGDPTGTGRGGSGVKIPAEFTRKASFRRGSVGAARSSDPNSADSQFFITFTATPFLDGQYTIWGQVVEGMQFVDRIQRGEPPRNPDKIVRMRVQK